MGLPVQKDIKVCKELLEEAPRWQQEDRRKIRPGEKGWSWTPYKAETTQVSWWCWLSERPSWCESFIYPENLCVKFAAIVLALVSLSYISYLFKIKGGEVGPSSTDSILTSGDLLELELPFVRAFFKNCFTCSQGKSHNIQNNMCVSYLSSPLHITSDNDVMCCHFLDDYTSGELRTTSNRFVFLLSIRSGGIKLFFIHTRLDEILSTLIKLRCT